MSNTTLTLNPEIISHDDTFTLDECCQTTQSPQAFVIELITEEIIHPKFENDNYYFTISHIQKIQKARSFSMDLGVNIEGIALALELLDQIYELRNGSRVA